MPFIHKPHIKSASVLANVGSIYHMAIEFYVSTPRDVFNVIDDNDPLVPLMSLRRRDNHEPITAAEAIFPRQLLPVIQLPVRAWWGGWKARGNYILQNIFTRQFNQRRSGGVFSAGDWDGASVSG